MDLHRVPGKALRWMRRVVKMNLTSFVDLIFPDCCMACDRPLCRGEELLCLFCEHALPKTDFHRFGGHEAFQLLGGHFPLESVLAYLYFDDESNVQHLVHRLKYHRKWELAYRMGVDYGEILLRAGHSCLDVDAIVPVPMVPGKLRKRGYNQSEVFARGLASRIQVPVWSNVLRRDARSETQVGKGRAARFANLTGAILPDDVEKVAGKHVLLADDVLTSGATVVACAQVLVAAAVGRISVAVIARKR